MVSHYQLTVSRKMKMMVKKKTAMNQQMGGETRRLLEINFIHKLILFGPSFLPEKSFIQSAYVIICSKAWKHVSPLLTFLLTKGISGFRRFALSSDQYEDTEALPRLLLDICSSSPKTKLITELIHQMLVCVCVSLMWWVPAKEKYSNTKCQGAALKLSSLPACLIPKQVQPYLSFCQQSAATLTLWHLSLLIRVTSAPFSSSIAQAYVFFPLCVLSPHPHFNMHHFVCYMECCFTC